MDADWGPDSRTDGSSEDWPDDEVDDPSAAPRRRRERIQAQAANRAPVHQQVIVPPFGRRQGTQASQGARRGRGKRSGKTGKKRRRQCVTRDNTDSSDEWRPGRRGV